MRRFLRPSVLVASIALGVTLLAGCSGESGGDPTPSPATPTIVALAPFATTNCAVVQPPIPEQSAPVAGQEVDGVVVQLDPAGVPTVTVAAGATPASELVTLDLVTGAGAQVAIGGTVEVNYCGIGLSSRTIFDSSWARGAPAAFPLDPGGLIQGWIDGLPGMKVGGERLLLIPGSLAYGPNPPSGSGIEPDETLIFIVQITAVS